MIYNAACALNITCCKPTFLKQTVLDIKRQVSPETMIMGDFNTSLSSIDRYCKGKKSIHLRVKLQLRLDGHDRHPHNNPSNICRIYILLSSPQTGLQNILYFRPQSKS